MAGKTITVQSCERALMSWKPYKFPKKEVGQVLVHLTTKNMLQWLNASNSLKCRMNNNVQQSSPDGMEHSELQHATVSVIYKLSMVTLSTYIHLCTATLY